MSDRTLSRLQRMAVATMCVLMAGCSGRVASTTRPTVAAGEGAETASNTVAGVAAFDQGDGYQAGFYPLRIGNRWDYLVTVIHRAIPDVGGPLPPETYQFPVTRQQTASETIDGRRYVIEERTSAPNNEPGIMMATWYRQDVTGLYELQFFRGVGPNGVTTAAPTTDAGIGPGQRPLLERSLAGRPAAEQAAYRLAARRLAERVATLGAAFGASPGSRMAGTTQLGLPGPAGPYELTRLRYPLQAKSRWVVVQGPGFEVASEFVGIETLELRPGDLGDRRSLVGYRIRLRSSWMGPNDSFEVWFGPSGFLRSVLHAELDAVDDTGNIIGRVAVDQREEVTFVHLANPLAASLPWTIPRPK